MTQSLETFERFCDWQLPGLILIVLWWVCFVFLMQSLPHRITHLLLDLPTCPFIFLRKVFSIFSMDKIKDQLGSNWTAIDLEMVIN